MDVLPSLLLEESLLASQVVLLVQNLPAKAEAGGLRQGFNPGLGRSARGRNSNPLQYFLWRIPWTEAILPGYRPSGCKESDMTAATEHITCGDSLFRVSLMAQILKSLPAMQETRVQSLG